METVSICPVCNNNTFKSFLTCKDYLVSNESFNIQECKKCGFRLTNPRPDDSTIGSFYKSEQYISHNDEGGGLINTAYRLVRKYTLQSKINLIEKLNGGKGRILDIGCGTGAFLESCKESGWQVQGMEPDDDAREIATEKLQTDIKPNLLSLGDAGQYDIITLWHVLEHIPNLNDTIPQLFNLLSDQGTLLIAVPNSESYDAQYFKQYWAAYDVPRHLHHFIPSTIKSLFKKHHLELIAQKPMVFDAFYIAMLSTRYEKGKTDYIRSLQIGLKSNAEARRTGNSSSLIYHFKKA